METREMKKIHSHHGGVHNPLDQLNQKENASLCTRRVTQGQRAGISRGFLFFHFCPTFLPRPEFSFYKTGNYEISLLYIII